MIRRYSGLLVITLVGLLLRLINIDAWPLWSDEALTLLIAQWPLTTLFFAPGDPTPGLYYALHKALLGPYVGVAGARAISVAAGTLLIPASYFLARKARVPAYLTATLVALSFPLIDYSQEARAYSLLLLIVTVSAGLFLWWARTERLGLLAGSLAFGVLAFYTHFAAIFWAGPLALAALATGKRRAVPLVLAMAIIATPEVSRLAQYPSGGFVWLIQASPQQAANTLAQAVMPFRLSGFLALALALLLAGRTWMHRSALIGWVRANQPAAAALLIFLTMPLAIWLFGFIVQPIFMPRTILIAVPGFMLAFALLLSFERCIVRMAVVGLYAASLVVTGTMRPREDWRAVARHVGPDALLMCEIGHAGAARHVLGQRSRVLIAYGDGVLDIAGVPWQRAYFEALTDEATKSRAAREGQDIAGSLYPVWTVRNGSPETLPAKPTTLDEAIRLCDANHHANNAARYEAE